jgi:hypothetical protein
MKIIAILLLAFPVVAFANQGFICVHNRTDHRVEILLNGEQRAMAPQESAQIVLEADIPAALVEVHQTQLLGAPWSDNQWRRVVLHPATRACLRDNSISVTEIENKLLQLTN